jgi:histidine triad (HIT) family protein
VTVYNCSEWKQMKNDRTIFQKIVDREIPANIVYENDDCLAFHDVDPKAPVHVLVIPKKPIANVGALSDGDLQLAGRLVLAVRDVARRLGVEESGYRIVANCGRDGGQSVDHLHFHVLGGRQMLWPPG